MSCCLTFVRSFWKADFSKISNFSLLLNFRISQGQPVFFFRISLEPSLGRGEEICLPFYSVDVLEAFVAALPSSRTLLSWLFPWPPLTTQTGLSLMSPSPVGWSPEAAPVIPKNTSACIRSLPIYCLLGLFTVWHPPGSVNSRRGGTCPLLCPQKTEQCLVCGRDSVHVSRMKVGTREPRMLPPQ